MDDEVKDRSPKQGRDGCKSNESNLDVDMIIIRWEVVNVPEKAFSFNGGTSTLHSPNFIFHKWIDRTELGWMIISVTIMLKWQPDVAL